MTLAERIEKFNNLMGDIVPPEVKKDLLEKGFFTAPASTKYHGNYEGGLFDHSYMVARYLKKLTEDCRLEMCIRDRPTPSLVRLPIKSRTKLWLTRL